ncbi:MAG: phosphate acyltransferase PlsX [Deltaproteobacteria bacterium]|nr:phosphate acyltransferase PlsX [Deltaproteobacteria bacterium]MBI2181245.1 phosphate acyltransferase PlsX [Deltaproteobacteria bacterium]MBI2230303.1 phosphate acyltransferase PlsX [Deltaproteobacteria bacterium]MBI2364906.1 phosphate acyltransferase PlsX [Deltaproteobacteria bacterium]MBI2534137.1 phosphate acyltransferase PlsX [Deltaproteobacteria bacterium]
MPKIAVDAMGGDHAPRVVVDGALLAAHELGVGIVLVGEKEAVERELARHPRTSAVEVAAASQVVTMHESPSSALRKKDSSMKVAFEMMKRGEVEAVVSAGNSGAMMATGMFVMGTLSEVARPAILIVVPSITKATVIIDAGANVDCKPGHLVQFGLMGSIYAERILGIKEPRIGVLSNGEEDGKGNELTRAASEQLSATALNYIGYVEGRDIFNGRVDVIVCDGFTGNVALKTMEGAASFAGEVLKSAFEKNLTSRLGYLLARSALREAYRRLDYAEYGGAPLIGLDGVGIIAHGGSNPRAIKNAIRAARDEVEQDVNRHIVDVLGEMGGEAVDGLPRKIWRRLKSKIETLGEK